MTLVLFREKGAGCIDQNPAGLDHFGDLFHDLRLRLYEIFQNPTRLPIQLTVNDSSEAINAVVEGKALAAIVPTPVANNYGFLNTVMTTKAIPNMAFSASPNIPEAVQRDIQNALIEAHNTKDGQEMLKRVKLDGFESTSAKEYEGYSDLLKDSFGYVAPAEFLSQNTY